MGAGWSGGELGGEPSKAFWLPDLRLLQGSGVGRISADPFVTMAERLRLASKARPNLNQFRPQLPVLLAF